MILRPGYLPGMYVIGLLPLAALIVAATSDAVWRRHVRSRYLATGDHPRPRLRADQGRRQVIVSRASSWFTLVAIGAVAFAFVRFVAVPWTHGAQVATTSRPDEPTRAAERWLVRNVGHEQRLIVDDEFWIYLVEHGFDAQPVRGGFFSRTLVSYWPLDYDPAVARRFPRGKPNFEYIVSTVPMRTTTDRTPNTLQALNHSRVVVSFGRGAQRIEIREISGAQSLA